MTISYNWLSDYLPVTLAPQDLAEILTSIGLEVEGTETIGQAAAPSLDGLIVGHVLECTQHPNADRLKVTRVSIDADREPLQIVCGAPNVAQGQKVIVAPIGAMLHPSNGEPFKIKKSKIRGEVSEGMLCAGDEIGLSDDHSGLLLLPDSAEAGKPVSDYLQTNNGAPQADTIIHIGLTPNRYDAASHYGVARDVCAYLAWHRKDPAIRARDTQGWLLSGAEGSPIKVTIDAPAACPRYLGVLLEGVRVGPSPAWMQERLTAIGVRAINNVVDITNYLLHKLGHPLHAFDADRIAGGEIRARFFPEGTEIITLDGVSRKLRATDLAIADAEKPLAIAGVFGGQGSGVTEQTTRVFLESAYFDPAHIRRTALHHGLRTEAAVHFEKGADPGVLSTALNQAAALIIELCGGADLAGEVQDAYPQEMVPAVVECSYDYVRRLSGKQYSDEAIRDILKAQGFGVDAFTDATFKATVPSWKTDVRHPADLLEEIIRIDGLDRIPMPGRVSFAATAAQSGDRLLRMKISNLLTGAGFSEILTNSIASSEEMMGGGIMLLNSISADLNLMRDSLLVSALEVVAYNINRQASDLLLYEFGSVYSTQGIGRYQQHTQLQLVTTGIANGRNWRNSTQSADFYFLKGVVENILAQCGISNWQEEKVGDGIRLLIGDKHLAVLSNVPESWLKGHKIKQSVAQALLLWETVAEMASAVQTRFVQLPKFPVVSRDLALVLDSGVAFAKVREAVAGAQAAFLQDYRVFDLFESDKLGAGKKSVGISFSFLNRDQTLTDDQVEGDMSRLVTAFQQLGAEIRS